MRLRRMDSGWYRTQLIISSEVLSASSTQTNNYTQGGIMDLHEQHFYGNMQLWGFLLLYLTNVDDDFVMMMMCGGGWGGNN